MAVTTRNAIAAIGIDVGKNVCHVVIVHAGFVERCRCSLPGSSAACWRRAAPAARSARPAQSDLGALGSIRSNIKKTITTPLQAGRGEADPRARPAPSALQNDESAGADQVKKNSAGSPRRSAATRQWIKSTTAPA